MLVYTFLSVCSVYCCVRVCSTYSLIGFSVGFSGNHSPSRSRSSVPKINSYTLRNAYMMFIRSIYPAGLFTLCATRPVAHHAQVKSHCVRYCAWTHGLSQMASRLVGCLVGLLQVLTNVCVHSVNQTILWRVINQHDLGG